MAYIVEIAAGDRRLQLGNEEFVRTMAWGTNWQYIRICCRHTVNGSSTMNNVSLCFGVCRGSTNTYRSTSTTDYIGMQLGGTFPDTTWTYAATYYATTGGLIKLTRVGNATTATYINTGLAAQYLSAGSIHGEVFLDVYKDYGNNRCALKIWAAPNGGMANIDVDRYTYLTQMEREVAPGNPLSGFTGDTVVPQDLNLLDTVSLSWNKSTPTIEFSDLTILRFA